MTQNMTQYNPNFKLLISLFNVIKYSNDTDIKISNLVKHLMRDFNFTNKEFNSLEYILMIIVSYGKYSDKYICDLITDVWEYFQKNSPTYKLVGKEPLLCDNNTLYMYLAQYGHFDSIIKWRELSEHKILPNKNEPCKDIHNIISKYLEKNPDKINKFGEFIKKLSKYKIPNKPDNQTDNQNKPDNQNKSDNQTDNQTDNQNKPDNSLLESIIEYKERKIIFDDNMYISKPEKVMITSKPELEIIKEELEYEIIEFQNVKKENNNDTEWELVDVVDLLEEIDESDLNMLEMEIKEL